jgi:hypothetical membrane protein
VKLHRARGKFYLFRQAILQRMSYPRGKVAGTLFFIAATQFILCLIIAEALYPGYSVSRNYISDLGVGPSAIIFNASVFLLGALLLAGTYLQRHNPALKTVNTMLLLMAIGAMSVGIFTKDFTLVHGAVSSAAFFFAGLSAITSCKILPKPLSQISIVLGAMTLAALALFSAGIIASGSMTSNIAYDSTFYLGLGPGGMERMIVYPALMWLAAFGGHLITKQET